MSLVSQKNTLKVNNLVKSNNGINEENNIKIILESLNNNTDLGVKLISSLRDNMKIEFKKAYHRKKSNRKSHYDFIIEDNNGVIHQIEHKGSYIYKKIEDTDTPWKSGVQFVNAGCEKFNVGRIYSKLWYDNYLYSKYLSDCYKLSSDIPTFNTWYKSDCCTQGDPKTLFGKELKKVYREQNGNTSLLHLRKEINKQFIEEIEKNPVILNDFKDTVITFGNECLKEKHIWLQINGNLLENVDFKWYNKFLLSDNYKIDIIVKSDIDFNFISTTNDMNFSCKLRWGKGAGFSNLRIDFK